MAKKIIPIPLDEIIGTADEVDRSIPSPEESLFRRDLDRMARKVLETLTPAEKEILRMRFGIKEKDED